MGEVKVTTDYYPVSELFYETDLEIPPSHETPEEIVKMWCVEDDNTGELIAAATLEYRDDRYVLAGLASRKGHQKGGYGKKLQEAAFEEVRRLGGTEIWVCARLPEYYKHTGWIEMPWQELTLNEQCKKCENYHTTCTPCIAKKIL